MRSLFCHFVNPAPAVGNCPTILYLVLLAYRTFYPVKNQWKKKTSVESVKVFKGRWFLLWDLLVKLGVRFPCKVLPVKLFTSERSLKRQLVMHLSLCNRTQSLQNTGF